MNDTPEEATIRALQHAAYIGAGGPEEPPTCVLCGVTYPDSANQYGTIQYYGTRYDGFQCRSCTSPLSGYSGCEGCALPLGPIPSVTLSSEEEGVALRFHAHCVNLPLAEGVTYELETWKEMLVRWEEDKAIQISYEQ